MGQEDINVKTDIMQGSPLVCEVLLKRFMEKEKKLAGQIEALSFSLNLTLLKGRFYLKILQKIDLFWITGNLQVDHLCSVLYKT